MTLEAAFDSGTLVHPRGERPNSVELFRTLTRLAGGRLPDESLNERALSDLVGHHDHYLVVVVDGLGESLLPFFPAGGFFAGTKALSLTSVFPSTTAVALTSLATASWPTEHGLTGWFTFFPEHRRVIAPLSFVERGTRTDAGLLGLAPSDLVSGDPVLGSFFRTVRSFFPAGIASGAYARWSRAGTPIAAYRGLAQAARMIRRHYRRTPGPTYSYLYLPTVDAYSHEYGTTSQEVADDVARIDRLLGRVRDSLPASVRLVVTADHGLVDVPEHNHFTFRDGDPLARYLVAGQTGEAATPVFHVRAGSSSGFLEEFARHPASRLFTLYPSNELVDAGLYGPGTPSEALRLHLGDYVGIAEEPALLEYVSPGPDGGPGAPVPHRGVHGGLRPGEMLVPLFLA